MSSARPVLLTLAGSVLLLADAAAATPTWESSRLLIGRVHPLLVHFPVALLLVAGLLELWGALVGRTERSPAARACLAFGTLGAVAAAFSGWTWAEREPVSALLEERLFLHRWAGVTVAGTAAVAWAALSASGDGGGTTPRRVGRIALLLCVGAVLFAGHEGGEMARGEAFMHDAIDEFLAGEVVGEERPEGAGDGAGEGDTTPSVQPGPQDDAPVDGSAAGPSFARDVQPILEARCYECHGPSKQKGGVRFDQPAPELFELHGDHAVILRGDPDASEMIQLVSLPADDLDIMPPEGDPLTAEQVATLRAWVAAGADWPAG